MGSHAATASGASTVPCSGTSPARFRATPYSAGGTLRSGGPRATEFVHSRVPDRELNTTNRAPRARQAPTASDFDFSCRARATTPSIIQARQNGTGNAQVNRHRQSGGEGKEEAGRL